MGTDEVTFAEACESLDAALCSDRLAEPADVQTLVAKQLHWELQQKHSQGEDASESEWVQRAANEAWEFVEALRSAAGDRHAEDVESSPAHHKSTASHKGPTRRRHNSMHHSPSDAQHGAWKLKEQGKKHRVLYRPGPEGTPLHSLCLEGILQAPLATVLCVCWETGFFADWWPQFTVPPFKVAESGLIERLSPGRSLTSTKLKIPWPFAPRELAVFSRLTFRDAATGLVVVNVSGIPDDPSLCRPEKDGFAGSAAARVPSGYVRLGVSGGYTLLPLSPNTCYFRGIVAVDLKMDAVPAWAINFVSRQLAGSGFHLLSQVVVDVGRRKGVLAESLHKLLVSDQLYAYVASPASSPEIEEAGAAPQPVGDGMPARTGGELPPETVLAERDPEMDAAVDVLEAAIRAMRGLQQGGSPGSLVLTPAAAVGVGFPSSCSPMVLGDGGASPVSQLAYSGAERVPKEEGGGGTTAGLAATGTPPRSADGAPSRGKEAQGGREVPEGASVQRETGSSVAGKSPKPRGVRKWLRRILHRQHPRAIEHAA